MNFGDTRLPERFWNKVTPEPNSGCWLWFGAAHEAGYGHRWNGERQRYESCHRSTYEAVHGDVPDNLQIDHLCKTKSCCNPDHLEAVTAQENMRRSGHQDKAIAGYRAYAAAITSCPYGHPYDDANTYVSPKGTRACRTCRRLQDRARSER